MLEQERWHAAWKDVGAQASAAVYDELIARYSEPGRYYHTLQHLGECFVALDAARHLAQRPAEIEIALWFHDAVYDTRAHDNEEQCARWAEQALLAGGAPQPVAARISDLVLATRHDRAAEDGDARLLVDVDLAILGADEQRFDQYEHQVRQEYGWVEDDRFRQGRARILESLLARRTIYSTTWFVERLEERARANLTRSLRQLGQQ